MVRQQTNNVNSFYFLAPAPVVAILQIQNFIVALVVTVVAVDLEKVFIVPQNSSNSHPAAFIAAVDSFNGTIRYIFR